MRYTLTYTFLEHFRIPIEVGANFDIKGHTIFITSIDDVARLVTYAAVER